MDRDDVPSLVYCIYTTQPQLCLDISYTGMGLISFIHSKGFFPDYLEQRMQRYEAPSFSCIYRSKRRRSGAYRQSKIYLSRYEQGVCGEMP